MLYKIQLSSFCKYRQGTQCEIENQSLIPLTNYKRFIRIIDYTNNSEPPRYILDNNYLRVTEEDIVMLRYGSLTAGKAVKGIKGIIANNMFLIDFKDGCIAKDINNIDIKIDKNFLFYYLSSNFIYNKLHSTNISSTMPAISFKDMDNLFITIPNYKSQLKIGKILKSIDNQIERNNAITKRLQVLAQTTYSRWFNQFEYPNADKELVFNKELGKEIPKNWILKNLQDISNLYQSKTITEKEILENSGQYKVYGANGIIGNYYKYNHKNNEITITCRGNSCGNMLMTLPYSWITGNSMVIGLTEKMNYKEYLYYFLQFTDLSKCITGSAQPQITANNLGLLRIIIPNKELLEQFEVFAINIRKQIEKIIIQTEELITLKEKLLPLLINGQLNI